MVQLPEIAKQVRMTIMNQVISDGFAPTRAEIQKKHGLSDEELDSIFKDLEAAIIIAVQRESHVGLTEFHGELLDEPLPGAGEVFYARPFANFKSPHKIWVNGEQKWYGECAVESCLISIMFPGQEVVVRSICQQTKEPVQRRLTKLRRHLIGHVQPRLAWEVALLDLIA